MERASSRSRVAGAGVGERRPYTEGNGAGVVPKPGGRCGLRRAPPLHREAMERASPVRRVAGAGVGERRPYTGRQRSGRRPCAGWQVRASASAAPTPGGNGAGDGGGFGGGEEGAADAAGHGGGVHPKGVEFGIEVVEHETVDAEGLVVLDGVVSGVG